MEGGVGGIGERGLAHFACDRNADETVAPGALDLTLGDLDGLTIFQLHEPAPLRQRQAAAVEDEA